MENNALAEIGKILIEAQIERSRKLATRPFYRITLAKIDHELNRRAEIIKEYRAAEKTQD